LRFRVVTVSSSRYSQKTSGAAFSDESGDAAEAELLKAGHVVSARSLISDDSAMIRRETRRFLSGADDVLVFTGGTGVSRRDVTIETVKPLMEKELPGFGEIFRRISYDTIGAASMLSRATAGVAKGKLLVCLPGSPRAVETALRATLSEFPHAIFIARS
jgi:molybdenum cofactor biosynthesis protein B